MNSATTSTVQLATSAPLCGAAARQRRNSALMTAISQAFFPRISAPRSTPPQSSFATPVQTCQWT